MLDGVAGITFDFILCGIIWAVALGFAVGNYACSLVHRLPRGRLILDQKPYCGSCGAPLQVRDLFPVVSALLLRHRCRYCRVPFPVSHTWTELLVGLLFVLAFLQYNFTEPFILVVTVGVFLITLAAIEANEAMVMGRILLCVAVFGALNRTLADGSIYGFFEGALFGLILGALLWRKEIRPVGHIYSFPEKVQLLTVGGLCVGEKGFLPFIALYAVLWAAGWLYARLARAGRPLPLTVPFGFAVMIVLMYGGILFPLPLGERAVFLGLTLVKS
jgi:leader peptidase (prepilin peptidase)/N-methyltransferase